MLLEYKKAGETMDQFIKNIKKKYLIKKLAYTARLDPMAKGVVPIAINDECKRIETLFNTEKTYQVKIILGIKTDSDDALGIIQNNIEISKTRIEIIKELIINYLHINKKSFQQKYHYFSTKMLNHRKQKTEAISETHLVSLNDYKIIKEGEYKYNIWLEKIINQINNIDITKNFRQKEIIEQWKSLIIEDLHYIKFEFNVSSGFFIRQLINDISISIGIPLMCYSINRISVK